RILDLAALREPLDSAGEADPVEVERLLDLVPLPPGQERDQRMATALEPLEARAERMRSLLATARLARDTRELARWLEEEDRAAREAGAAVRQWRPETGTGADVPAEIRREKKTARKRTALAHAVEGGQHDPLDAELAYAAGELATDFGTRLDALSNFDRFLALRGIRAHDDRAWRGRELTAQEQRALSEVQQGLR